jgi:UDP-4-amino-4,6-dideoxy-N-acetyl-beta-L-altrosamine transaminase
MIPYGRQSISEADIQAVRDILRSDFLTQGPAVPAFEDAVSRYCQAREAVASNSGTSSLHLACLALGVGSGDRVWTSPITFVASANCARYCGADVEFIDIDQDTGNISIQALRNRLRAAAQNNTLPKVVIPVHFAGQPCDMEAIHALGLEYGFEIIEDGCHALGARYYDQPVGNCRYSAITVFSFHPVKIITTGEGGLATTNSRQLAEKMRLLRSHGITRDADRMVNRSDGPWYYEQLALGFNYRMTDIQAALGISQLERLDRFVQKRNALARRYDRLLAEAGLPVRPLARQPDRLSSFHLYVVRVRTDVVRQQHREIFTALRDRGIGVNLHYIPVYHQPYYNNPTREIETCPGAEQYYASAITLPLYPDLEEQEQDRVVQTLTEVIGP